jgi:hypothetical protein
MQLIEFLRHELTRLHSQYERAISDLTDEQWHVIPEGKGNSIAFCLWHFVRTEDNVVRFILQDRQPTTWMEGGWAEKFGLHPVAQGTGMSLADAQALSINDTAAFREYAGKVFSSTISYLEAVDAATLDTVVQVRPLGEMPKIRALGQVCVTHGFGHLGEVDHIRALLDLPGIGI